MLAASTEAATQELAGFRSSIWRSPRNAWKRPLVVLTDKTRIANDTCEWVGSMFQIMVILLEKLFCKKNSHLMCVFRVSSIQADQSLRWYSHVEKLECTRETNVR